MTRISIASSVFVMSVAALVPVSTSAAPPSMQTILRLCSDADGAQHCERLLEAEQIKQFPGVAVRDGATLRLGSRRGTTSIELRDAGEPGLGEGAEFRAYAFWDYWPQRKTAIVSVTARDSDYYVVAELDRGKETRIASEPILAPDGQRFVVSDLCDTKCGNVLEIWRFDRDRLVKEKSFTPLEKWYEAEVRWRDASTLEVEYSVATPEPRFDAAGERVLVRAKPRQLKLSDWAWVDEERRR